MLKFFGCVLITLLLASSASAGNAQPVWSADYPTRAEKSQTAQRQNNIPPAPVPSIVYRKPQYNPAPVKRSAISGGADAAWGRQWGPIQELTGFSSGQAKQFIAGVKEGYIAGTAKTLSSAQDWALILGQTGLVGTVTDSTTDWFNYVATDVPNAVMRQQPGAMGSNNLMGGLSGFGAYPGE